MKGLRMSMTKCDSGARVRKILRTFFCFLNFALFLAQVAKLRTLAATFSEIFCHWQRGYITLLLPRCPANFGRCMSFRFLSSNILGRIIDALIGYLNFILTNIPSVFHVLVASVPLFLPKKFGINLLLSLNSLVPPGKLLMTILLFSHWLLITDGFIFVQKLIPFNYYSFPLRLLTNTPKILNVRRFSPTSMLTFISSINLDNAPETFFCSTGK